MTLYRLDCTAGIIEHDYDCHMNLRQACEVRLRMIDMGCAGKDSIFVVHHFSHNGGAVYDDFCAGCRRKRLPCFIRRHGGRVLKPIFLQNSRKLEDIYKDLLKDILNKITAACSFYSMRHIFGFVFRLF